MFTIEELATIPLFSELGDKELEFLAGAVEDIHLIPGEYVSHEGDGRFLAVVVEGTYTLGDVFKLWSAALAGKVSGGGTSTLKFRDLSDTLDRITATVDASNRAARTIWRALAAHMSGASIRFGGWPASVDHSTGSQRVGIRGSETPSRASGTVPRVGTGRRGSSQGT